MKKKRTYLALIGIAFLTLASVFLFINVYHLYIEAEKAQKTTFTGDVLLAGQEIVKEINNEIQLTQKLPESIGIEAYDSTLSRTRQTFLFDTNSIALVNETTIDYFGNSIVIQADTILLANSDAVLTDSLLTIPILNRNDSNQLSQMSHLILASINKDALNLLISNILKKHQINTDFDYCIYNLTDNVYVIPPKSLENNIIKNGYVFALSRDENLDYSHYLVLYFPYERTFFLQRMGSVVIPIIVLLLTIVFISTYTIVSFNRLKKNEEIKNDFLNNITHEFKTPISTISLACESLSDDTIQHDRESSALFISIIQSENNRLQSMVTNILQLAQLRKGQVRMEESLINIHTILHTIVQSISLQVSNAGGKIITHFDAKTAEIIADKSHIENILVNVIENAIKYSPQTPTIEISTSNQKNMLAIAIKDNGIGIAQKNLKKIFDEFYRIPKGNLHDTKGYGLGLNHVKKIVDLHNGKIVVQSELKNGTTFIIYL